MRHFDVQLIGGMVLHNGKIAEMRTGEGKTLVATLPAYLNALSGKGVHVVTVNDYLAKPRRRVDGPALSLPRPDGRRVNLPGMPHDRQAGRLRLPTSPTAPTTSSASTTCATTWSTSRRRARAARLNYAIVDEVDSILIDEARTPLIISGQAEDHTELYMRMNQVVPMLSQKARPTREGRHQAGRLHGRREGAPGAPDRERARERRAHPGRAHGLLRRGRQPVRPGQHPLMHHLYAALRAHHLYHRDQHYVVQNGEVVIVDEFTGRLMPGRRWSDGLHQAVEAKEGVPIQARTRRWPRSPSRTTSACTASWPA
jgi:preprotein translocase subunit SecA